MESGSGVQVIDGSVMEGGGQILRNAISLAALLQKPVRIENIRCNRSSPGLKNQHRTGLELAARIASAQLTGCSNGSTQIEFVPGQIEVPGRWKADTVTAGATTLLMQVAFPMLLFTGSPPSPSGVVDETARSELKLLGGTNAGQAPQIDYTQHVFLPFFKKHFLPPSSSPEETGVELDIKKRGYFPKGGGEVNLRVRPLGPGQKLRAVNLLERGRLVAIGGLAHCAGLPRSVGNGMREGALECVWERMKAWAPEVRLGVGGVRGSVGGGVDPDMDVDVDVNIGVKREPNELTRGAGSGIVVWAEFENGVVMGGSAIGKKGLEPRMVGRSAVEELFRGIEAGGCVEEWMQDQMIIFMALAVGKSEVRCGTEGLSLHTKTAIWVAEQLSEAKFEVKQEESGHWTIRCEGIGFTMK